MAERERDGRRERAKQGGEETEMSYTVQVKKKLAERENVVKKYRVDVHCCSSAKSG